MNSIIMEDGEQTSHINGMKNNVLYISVFSFIFFSLFSNQG